MKAERREEVIKSIRNNKIIAIVRGFLTAECIDLAGALLEGGIHLLEITYNQQRPQEFFQTTDSIRAISDQFKGKLLVGAGTVLTTHEVDLAKEAGALYIISPNMNPEVIKYTKKQGLVSIPGAMSPTEIVDAHRAGADFVKIFPACNLGSDYIKALKGPLSHIDLLAVGGVNERNVKEFLTAGAEGVGVGGMLTKRELVESRDFKSITQLAKEYVNNAK